ncbi:gluconokinase [Corynebacterium hindlerae]|uniref:gluconokinase n=1 Tax=Corynebacterium hindlerae TaxID=699041 RepID=UPI001AD62DD7|nr:gluconokinase [Corynebacterium hindlerae]QTH59435.1 gluconokinase [Corynebacterium hindlerae]
MAHQPMHVVLMGVSGCGKTSVASAISNKLGWPYAEADDFHPEANKTKMAAGIALTDEDRWPWLDSLKDWMTHHAAAGNSTVVTCSALKRSYRDLLTQAKGEVLFVHLDGPQELIAERMTKRVGHFMPTTLLPSQFATLERLDESENGVTVDITPPIPDLVKKVLGEISLRQG